MLQKGVKIAYLIPVKHIFFGVVGSLLAVNKKNFGCIYVVEWLEREKVLFLYQYFRKWNVQIFLYLKFFSELLSKIILSPDKNSHRIRDVAARDILRLSKRHGQSNESISRILICRSCESVMRFGRDSRIRIRKQSVITTCLRCENKTRKPL